MHGLIFETSVCYWQNQPGCYLCSHLAPRSQMKIMTEEFLRTLGIDFQNVTMRSQLLILSIIWINWDLKNISLANTQFYHLVPSMRFWFPRKWRGCSCSKSAFSEKKHIWRTLIMLSWFHRFGNTTKSFHQQQAINASMTSTSDNEQHPDTSRFPKKPKWPGSLFYDLALCINWCPISLRH